jgi:MraZ protein
MSTVDDAVIIGEFRRVLDERHRLTLPTEIVQYFGSDTANAVLAKERDGCLSLWKPETWNLHFDRFMRNLANRVRENIYESRQIPDVQRVARLISTRATPVQLGGRGRLLLPQGFREFLSVEPNAELTVVGAGVCVEIWRPDAWIGYLKTDLASFNDIFRQVAG